MYVPYAGARTGTRLHIKLRQTLNSTMSEALEVKSRVAHNLNEVASAMQGSWQGWSQGGWSQGGWSQGWFGTQGSSSKESEEGKDAGGSSKESEEGKDAGGSHECEDSQPPADATSAEGTPAETPTESAHQGAHQGGSTCGMPWEMNGGGRVDYQLQE